MRKPFAITAGFGLTIALASSTQAQQAPIGAHHAAGDITSTVGATGGFPASVDLALPGARGSVSVPLSLVYSGGTRVGAAGVGWDLPLSYVTVADTHTRQRPRFRIGDSQPQPLGRVFLTLQGGRQRMIPVDSSSYRAMVDGQVATLRRDGDDWVLHDGSGVRYQFEQLPGTDGSTWYLREINDSTGFNPVVLRYEVADAKDVTGAPIAVVRLSEVAYNQHPSTACMKHRVSIHYRGFGAGGPVLALAAHAGRIYASDRIIDSIDVTAAANCGGATERLRRYQLTYDYDVDTLAPRLVAADLYGREGTAQESVAIPLGRYQYGNIGYGAGYIPTNSIALPSEAAAVGDALSSMSESGVSYTTRHMIADFNGDGRADLAFTPNGFGGRHTLWARSRTTAYEVGDIARNELTAVEDLFDASTGDIPLGLQSTSQRRYRYGDVLATEETLVQTVDFNGDGRPDVIDARHKGRWRLLLNVPDPADPGGIQWQEKWIDTTRIGAELASRGLVYAADDRIALRRSRTGRDISTTMCWSFVYAGGGGAWKLCDDEPASVDAADQQTYVEWGLQDMNGDGWLDFVANSRPVERLQLDQSEFDCVFDAAIPKPSRIPPPGSDPRVRCSLRKRTGFRSANNKLLVYFNMAGAQLRDTTQPFSRPIALTEAGECSYELWTAPASGWNSDIVEVDGDGNIIEQPPTPIGPTSYQSCGAIDVNGDGIADRVDHGQVALGTGHGFETILDMPGSLTRVHNGRDSACEPDADGEVDPAAEYEVVRNAGFTDINGDGLLDHVSGGKVRFGTGAGWAPPRTVAAVGASLVLSRSVETCDGTVSRTIEGLHDMDGDGRPEIVKATGGSLQPYTLVGATGGIAALDAGRLILLENGYGAETEVSYVSAKNDFRTRHDVPFPEIVVGQVTTRSAKGELAPTRFAYGDAERHFDPSVDRWVFPGYRRSVTLRGIDIGHASVRGKATVVDRRRWDADLAPYDRLAATGKVSDVYAIDGHIQEDPWDYLTLDFSGSVAGWHGQTHHEYTAQHRSTASFDCVDLGDPYQLGDIFLDTGEDGFDWPCTSTGFTYAHETMSWRGDAPPPSQKNTATRTRVLDVDELGRVLLVAHDNDVYYRDDDLCERTSYARSNTIDNYRTAVHTRTTYYTPPASPQEGRSPQTCRDAGRQVLAYVRNVYDYQPDIVADGEGRVRAGLLTRRVVRHYNTTDHTLIREFVEVDNQYDALGNPVQASSARAGGSAPRVNTWSYDPFGLTAIEVKVSAGATSFVTSTEIDPYSLDVLATVDENGAVTNTYYDGFGRTTMTSVLRADGREEVRLRNTYLGDDPADPAGRRVRAEHAHASLTPTELDSAGAGQVTRVTSYIDGLGRHIRNERTLGGDYGGAVLVRGEVEHDALGRVTFAADPYPQGTDGPHYGRTIQYRDDGNVACVVRGRGPQNLASTSSSQGRFPRCIEVVYQNHRRILRTRGPNELAAGHSHEGMYDEVVTTARGWTLSSSRRDNSGVAEAHVAYTYDPLNHPIAVRRYRKPATLEEELVWRMQYQSTGDVLVTEEPAAAARTMTYDRWGNLVQTSYVDAGVVRSAVFELDPLGRQIRSVERRDGVDVDGTEVAFIYDHAPAGHPWPDNLAGRLALATSATMDIAYGYDDLGREIAVSRTGSDGDTFAEELGYRADGSLAWLRLNHPDGVDEVNYGYDSASRLQTIDWNNQDDRELRLLTVTDTDVFGRPVARDLGNGVRDLATYATADRRELRNRKLYTSSGQRHTYYLEYDGDLRVLRKLNYDNTPFRYDFTRYTYDANNRLASARTSQLYGGDNYYEEFEYDGLGNMVSLNDHLGRRDIDLTLSTVDRDRICNIERPPIVITPLPVGTLSSTSTARSNTSVGTATTTSSNLVLQPASPCEYLYDAVGNVKTIAETNATPRHFQYDVHGRIGRMQRGSRVAEFAYGPMGEITELDVVSGVDAEDRRDRRYGPLMERSMMSDPGTGMSSSVIERRIPGPGGVLAALRGDDLLFWHSDQHGTSLFTDASGSIVQERRQRAFGGTISETGSAGSDAYTKYGFNHGDALAGFGVLQIGARLYEPGTGRFLQRDPVYAPRNASRSHPYGFAWSDPVNRGDSSGLWTDCASGGDCDDVHVGTLVGAGVSWLLGQIWSWDGGGGDSGTEAETPDLEVRHYRNTYIGAIWAKMDVAGQQPTDWEQEHVFGDTWHDKNGSIHVGLTAVIETSEGSIVGWYGTFGDERRWFNRDGDLVATGIGQGLESGFWYDPIDFIAGSGPARKVFTGLTSGVLQQSARRGATQLSERYVWRNVRLRINGGPAAKRANMLFPRGIEYKELSHWLIPKRASWAPNWLKNGSWNLKAMWGSGHALADPLRYQFMPKVWKLANPLPSGPVRFWARSPLWFQIGAPAGATGGLGYGAYLTLGGDDDE